MSGETAAQAGANPQVSRNGQATAASGGVVADRSQFGFTVGAELPEGGRTGTIRTPHGDIATPAFIPVGTKATVKAVKPEDVDALGADAVLANAYHLFLQPGADIVD